TSIRFVGYQSEPRIVACFYQAADLYLHAAKADTFPTTILEALACGLPVVATAVGGIPEQVSTISGSFGDPGHRAQGKPNGILSIPGDPSSMAAGVLELL